MPAPAVPISSQKVYILDSLHNYFDSTLTNSTGAYSFTLLSHITSGDPILVWTTACGVYHQNFLINSGSSLTSNFSVCAGTAFYQLHGTISLGSGTNSGAAVVYLIRKQYDTTTLDTMLVAIDSILTSGATYSKSYSAIPYGTLLIKAALKTGNSSYSSYLPTYDTNSLMWSGARTLSSTHFQPSVTTDFHLIAGVNPGGPGFIGGSVLLGANKNAGVGDPLNSRILLLTTASGTAVAYTYSDAAGKFSFPNLAYGSYKIFGDALAKTNPALTVTISASNATVNSITFEENSTTFKGHIGNLGVIAGSALSRYQPLPKSCEAASIPFGTFRDQRGENNRYKKSAWRYGLY